MSSHLSRPRGLDDDHHRGRRRPRDLRLGHGLPLVHHY
jgi:hypothetical protein